MQDFYWNRYWHLLVSLLVICLSRTTRAYPIRAGHCMSGPVIGFESGGGHGREGMGSLVAGNISISFQQELSALAEPVLLNATQPVVIDAGIPYKVNVARSDGFFRGILMRLSGANGTNVETAWTSTTGETQVLPSTGELTGFNSACAPGVTALSHTSSNDKQEISAGFLLSEAVDAILEVTIVVNNSPEGSNFWHYSQFGLKVQDGGDVNLTTVSPQPSVSAAPSPIGLSTISPQPSISAIPGNFPSSSPIPTVAADVNFPSSSPIPTAVTDNTAPISPQDDIRVACRWWCSKIPTEWKSANPNYYAKCDW
eukprot:CAMPEP_0195304428 /NCGR_PEP_ID=MMETSP0707-20130614/34412_1 /TAXON_ID=33640 /ORGANISM="Asterionellopsis glacialis, Strain CCMP134" /LENGTH=311 /DNA_ID=CAMNT_0040368223 /DNA_START=120 /DNA_END=1052 /DNA_ORIENTATION=+